MFHIFTGEEHFIPLVKMPVHSSNINIISVDGLWVWLAETDFMLATTILSPSIIACGDIRLTNSLQMRLFLNHLNR